MKKLSKRILVQRGDYIINGLWKDGQMVQFDIDEKNNPSDIGSIYIAKVKDIVKNIQAAFVELAQGQRAYLSLRENENFIRINDTSDKPLHVEDEIIVQVSRDAVKTKDPVVTSKLNFTGKYAVIIHDDKGINISSKINDNEWKKQIRQRIGEEVEQDGYGMIIRTNAYEVDVEEVIVEVKSLVEQYQQLLKVAPYRTCFTKLYGTPAPYLLALRDTREQMEEIITDDKEIFTEVQTFLQEADPQKASLLKFYEDRLVPLKAVYATEKWIDIALSRQVWLKSGGYLVIEPTEALTVIDVNSGKSITGKYAEETFFKMNMEAAVEVARQLRLRNLSGIVIVDFIDMKEQEHKDTLMMRLGELLRNDPVKAVVVDMTKLGLVEITRQRIRKPIYEMIS